MTTPSQMSDEQVAVVDLVNRIFTAADARDWTTYRSLMVNDVYVDFAGVGPHKPGTAKADLLAANTSAALGAVSLTQHMLTNHVVDIKGDRARVSFYEQALHHHPALGDDPAVNTWTLYGRATRDAVKTQHGWQIAGAGLAVVHQTGNVNLLRDAAALAVPGAEEADRPSSSLEAPGGPVPAVDYGDVLNVVRGYFSYAGDHLPAPAPPPPRPGPPRRRTRPARLNAHGRSPAPAQGSRR